jgi:hypothetical protein
MGVGWSFRGEKLSRIKLTKHLYPL